ncbi:hypothetical protein VAEU17_280121 [Vibrio aestuarianus]|nr:hypothetical protein VAEU17_280121 [Vibrio aestuarianus]
MCLVLLLTIFLHLTALILRFVVKLMLTFVGLEPNFIYNYKCSMELSEQARERKKVKTC